MKINKLLSALFLPGLLVFAGCDVTPDGGGGVLGAGDSQQADPLVVDLPLAFIARPLPFDEDDAFVPHDALDPLAFNPGARLILKVRASVPAAEVDISASAFADIPDPDNPDQPALYDVKDLTASDDGLKLLFAMRAPEDPDLGDDEQATWNIWEYDRGLEVLRRIIVSDLNAEEGEDISPAYLPDGKIVFSSTRQRRSKAILLDENKPQFSALTEDGDDDDHAFVLHVMDEDGTNIEQITYNQSHDLYPTVISSGEIVFLRWDNPVNRDRLSLYRINPNGSNLTLLYGYHSQSTASNGTEGVFSRPLEMPDGRILVNLRPRISEKLGGDMVSIDTASYVDNTQPVATNPGASGPAQQSSSVFTISSDGSISEHGYFSSAYPLHDGTDRLLVSWSSCRVLGYRLNIFVEETGNEDPLDPEQPYALINDAGEYVDSSGLVSVDPVMIPLSELSSFPCNENTILLPQIPEAEPAYGIWIYDAVINIQSPVVFAEADTVFTEAIVLEPKTPATHIPDPQIGVPDPQVFGSEELVGQNLGVMHIRNVYDFDGTDTAPGGVLSLANPSLTSADQRPARFLRLTKAVSMPDDDTYDFDNSAFGIAGNQMKDILGYVPIEPDGSAMFQVPADVAFAISILDANGKRTSDRHQNWLTVRPGEIRHCSGCHSQNSEAPHGRLDAEPESSNFGALSNAHFPGTVVLDQFDTPQPPPDVGESMAQYWARVNGARVPSMDIVYTDDWTDESLRPKDASFDFSYSDLASGAPPMEGIACLTTWNELCRTVINYIDHIHPLWEAPRQIFDVDDPSLLLADNTCTSCHASIDTDGAAMVPAGNRQLDLGGTISDVNNDYYTSYAELALGDNAVELNANGILQDEEVQLIVNGVPQIEATDFLGNAVNVDENIVIQDVQLTVADVLQFEALDTDGVTVVPAPLDTTLTLVLDGNDNPIPFMVPEFVISLDVNDLPIPFMVPSNRAFGGVLNSGGALSSQIFFDVFELGGGTVDHSTFLNGAELKLIAEWLDIGGQYYNNPFEAPAN